MEAFKMDKKGWMQGMDNQVFDIALIFERLFIDVNQARGSLHPGDRIKYI